MSALPKYRQMDYARFDFRISNGLGSYLEPDWDDPGLGVEFYDSQGILRFTANQTSSPPLVSGSDRQGIFLALEGINLENFALGVCDARLSCRVNAEQVLPCPTVMEAFQVIPDSGTEPVYTTASKVKSELPAEIPAQLTDPVIEQYIFDASRKIDAGLSGLYPTPFPGIEQNPATPGLIERLCRKLALSESLIFLGTLNQMELNPLLEERAMAELDRIRKGELRIAGFEPNLSVYQGMILPEENTGDYLD